MFALHFVNRPLRGPDLAHLKLDCHVALASAARRRSRALRRPPLHCRDLDARRPRRQRARPPGISRRRAQPLQRHRRASAAGTTRSWPFVPPTAARLHAVEAARRRLGAVPAGCRAGPPPRLLQSVEHGLGTAATSTPSSRPRDGPGRPPATACSAPPTRSIRAPWRAWDGNSFTIRYADPYTSRAPPRPCQSDRAVPVSRRQRCVHDTRHKLWIALFQAAVTATTRSRASTTPPRATCCTGARRAC